MPHEIPQGPLEKIGTDVFDFESTNYLLIAEYYSWFPIIRRMRGIMTNATIGVIKEVYNKYSVPKTAMSDRGPLFSSKDFKGFQNQYCFDHSTSSQRYTRAMA